MASITIVTNKKGTVLRKVDMKFCTTYALDKAVKALESVIAEETDIVHIEVDYEGCDDSQTL